MSLKTVKEKNISTLIEELKSEHLEIIDALKEVKESGILTHRGQAKLISVKPVLLEHLKEEDKKLYPVFCKAAKQNKKLKEGLDVFQKDLESVSRVVFGFFDRFDKGVSGVRLLKDFETLFMILLNRMWNEENYLFVEYEELNKL